MLQEESLEKPLQNAIKTTIQKPINLALLFLLIAVMLRLIDIFLLNLDWTPLNILPSKIIPLILLVAYIAITYRTLEPLGLHMRLIGQSIALGIIIFSVYWIFPLILEVGITTLIQLFPIAGLNIPPLFFLSYITGFYIINSFMEEGLFRGLMQRAFMTKITALKANLIQAAIFGLWHLVWPIKQLITGVMPPIIVFFYALWYVGFSFGFGIVTGYMFQKTSNLIGPIVLHTLWNLAETLVITGYLIPLSATLTLFLWGLSFALGIGGLILAVIIVKWASYQLMAPELQPWNQPLTKSRKVE
jgi:membrane protease YdiL (CAAX protease family)